MDFRFYPFGFDESTTTKSSKYEGHDRSQTKEHIRDILRLVAIENKKIALLFRDNQFSPKYSVFYL